MSGCARVDKLTEEKNSPKDALSIDLPLEQAVVEGYVELVPGFVDMSQLGEIFRGILIVAGYMLGIGFILWHLLRRSEAPLTMLIRIVASIPVLIAMYFAGNAFKTQFQAGSPAAASVVTNAALAGLALAFIWVPAITAHLGSFFGGFYHGGNQKVIPKPFYSIYRTKVTMGRYNEALAEVRRQLDKFPTDLEGHMLLAELQAKYLNDLPGAEVTIHRLCSQPVHPHPDLSFALNQLADWHLAITKDRDSAKRALEKIMEIMPGTEMASRAAQRIGHLAEPEMLLESSDRQTVEVKKGVRDLGLLRGSDGRLKAPSINQEELAEEYVAHLEQHPLDTDAREKLAVIYAKYYHRLDLAMEQLELLIEMPGMASKKIVHWLNLKADLQVIEGDVQENIHQTLQRIIDAYPGQAYADNASRRLQTVRLEMNAKTVSKPVALGAYEQDIGLKSGPRRRA